MTGHDVGAEDHPADPDPLEDLGPEVAASRAVARLYRRIRILAIALFTLLLATVWDGTWPVPGVGPEVTVLALGCWLLGTNAWSVRHDTRGDEHDGVRGEVAADLALALVLTVLGGDLVARTLPLLGALVIVAAASRLPRREAYAATAVYVGISSVAILARWPSWAGWDQHDDLLVPLLPVLVGLPLAAVIVGELAAERDRTHQLVLGQSRRLSLVARQLGRANRQLATSNEELEAFAGRIAHDLRSPLGTVVTALETLNRRELPLPAETREYLLAQALRASSRSVEAVSALLDHATAEGRGPERALVDVGEVAGDVVATLPDAVLGATEVALPTEPALAWADPQLLRLVLQNLVTNALTHRGIDLAQVRVTVRDRHGEAVVSVEDDGVGIPADQRAEVFVPGSRTSAVHGLGLGLATCASIVERHGGRIWADASTLGGAAVRFTLPWPSDDDPTTASDRPTRAVSVSAGSASDTAPARGGQRTRATSSSSGSSNRTSSASYRPGSAPTTVTTSSPTSRASRVRSRTV